MSNKEIAINIINQIPEYKMVYVVNMLNNIKNLITDTDEVVPDEIDLQMIAEAQKVNDDSFISLDELAKELNLNV